MVQGERLRPPPGEVVLWDGFKWKPVPDTDTWHKWEPKPGGSFTTVREDDIPDAFWVFLAKRALMGEDP